MSTSDLKLLKRLKETEAELSQYKKMCAALAREIRGKWIHESTRSDLTTA